jgi:hypothetical protein
MTYTLGTAAIATGKAKSTILKAIRSGKISASKNVSNEWSIDPSELHRVFPPVSENSEETAQRTPDNPLNEQVITVLERENAYLKQLLERAEAKIDEKEERLREKDDDLRRKDQQMTALISGPKQEAKRKKIFGLF